MSAEAPDPEIPVLPAAARHSLSRLGRHLHASVLRTCLPVETLRELLPRGTVVPREIDDAVITAAVASAAAAGAEAEALNAALDRHHAPALARFARARSGTELLREWSAAAGSPAMPGAYWALLTHPLADRTLRHLAFGDVEMLAGKTPANVSLPMLLARRSVSPRRLTGPAPTPEALDLMLQAALAAPDHGRLHPWRVIEFRTDEAREALADLFEREKRGRDPLAAAGDLRRAREHAIRPPCLLAFVVSLRQRKRVPLREQWLAAGAALGNLLNAAHAQGYGAIVLSGDRCFDPGICADLGLGPHEFLAGFVSIGTVAEPAPAVDRPLSQTVWSCWSSPVQGTRATARPAAWAFTASDKDIG